MKNIRFISTILAFVMIVSALSSVFTLPVLADGESETTTTTTTTTTKNSILSEDYREKKYSTNEEKLSTMELVHSAYGYDLYYHKETGEVQIVNQTTGQYLSTNPYDVAATANKSTERVELLSQLIVTYSDGGTLKTLTSYADAAELGQINMIKLRTGIRVEYTIGKSATKRVLPMMIEKSRFENYVLAPLAESGDTSMYNQFKSYYMLKDASAPGLTEKEVQALYNTLPITREMAVYVIDPSVAKVERELTMFENFITTYTEYTYDDVLYDHELTGYTGTTKNPATFRMALEYYLTEEGLEVRLPARGIRYDAKQYPIENISILPYFGAYYHTEKGYVVLPDGSGTLVRFEDTADTVATTITNRLYGEDYAFYSQKSIANMENWTLPVYGMVENTAVSEFNTIIKEDGSAELVETVKYVPKGFFAVITEGDSLSEIVCASGGILNKYFSTSIKVHPRPSDSYPLDGISVSGSVATWTVVTDKKYTGNYKIKYYMLDGEGANYVNMASIYRDYLENTTDFSRKENSEDIELYIETLGAVDSTKRVLGVPVDVKKALTSFEDAKTMIDDLKKEDVTNVSIKYVGWANGGLVSTAPTKVDVVKVLGGKKGLQELITYANKNGVKIFPDYDFTYISAFGTGDKFSIDNDTVKTVDNRSAVHRVYSPVYQTFVNDRILLISPNRILGFYEEFKDKYEELGTKTISLGSLGSDLNSDHNKEESLNREDSKDKVKELLSTVKEDGYEILVNKGNSYTISYATDILDVPLESSSRLVASEEIPFVGMVLHGYKNFAGSPINLAGDYNGTILKTIENGASLNFLLSYTNTSALKADYGDKDYYSIRYDFWFDDVIQTYKLVNKVLSPVQNAVVVSHDFVDYRVVEMVYDNGVTYVINYNDTTVTVKEANSEFTIDFENSNVITNGKTMTFAEFVKE